MAARSLGNAPQNARSEDYLLLTLGILAGPLLWWVGLNWQQSTAMTTVQTLEHWVALLSGTVGLGICVVWAFICLTSVLVLIGVKTRLKRLTSVAVRLTPGFMRRILVSVVGVQLVIASQAVASPDIESEQTAFMPDVASSAPADSLPLDDTQPTDKKLSEETSATPSELSRPEAHGPDPTEIPTAETEAPSSPTSLPAPTETLSPTPQPRQSSRVEVSDEPVLANTLGDQSGSPVDASMSVEKSVPRRSSYVPPKNPMSWGVQKLRDAEQSAQNTYIVSRGDSLWEIARIELGGTASLHQIDNRWRQWWAHNKHTIGNDPHVLLAGTVLETPPHTS